MAQKQYVEGSVRVQLALLALLVLMVGLFFYLQSVIAQVLWDIQLLSTTAPSRALKIAGRLLLWLVLFSGGMALATSFYLLVLGQRVRRCGVYPPPGMPVAFRTAIKTEAKARTMAIVCQGVAVVLILQPVIGFYFWYRLTGGAW